MPIYGAGCADPFSRRVLRVSMGNALFVPVIESAQPEALLDELQRRFSVVTVATVLDGDAEPLESVECPDRVALVFGNESDGLADEWSARCQRRVTIPMQGGTDSLNVAVSAGIFLFWFTRAQAGSSNGGER